MLNLGDLVTNDCNELGIVCEKIKYQTVFSDDGYYYKIILNNGKEVLRSLSGRFPFYHRTEKDFRKI